MSHLQIGKVYQHPEDGLILITDGQYEVDHRVSNFWYWRVLSNDQIHHGYGGDWPEAPDSGARDRVAAFIHRWGQMSGHDLELIYGVGSQDGDVMHELRVSDLLELLYRSGY